MPIRFSNNEQNISRRTVRSAGKHEMVDSMEALQMTVIENVERIKKKAHKVFTGDTSYAICWGFKSLPRQT